MEKRAIYAILLTFIIIMIWSLVQSKFFPPSTQPQPQEARKEQVSSPEKVPEKTEIKESRLLTGGKTPAKAKVAPPREVSVETQNYLAVFTSEGARLKHFKLKKYKDRVEESLLAIKLIQLVDEILGKPVEKPRYLNLSTWSIQEMEKIFRWD